MDSSSSDTRAKLQTALGDSLTQAADGSWTSAGAPLAKLLQGAGQLVGLSGLISALPQELQVLIAAVNIDSLTFKEEGATFTLDIRISLAAFTLGLVRVGSSSVQLRLGEPGGPSASLSASQITFGGTDLAMRVSMELPSLLLSAELSEGSPDAQTGAAVLSAAKLQGDDKAQLPVLNDLRLLAALREPRLILHLSVSNLFHVERLTLREIQVDATFAGGQSTPELLAWTVLEVPYAAASADDSEGVLELILRGEYGEAGWSLDGGLVPGSEVSLTQLLGGLAKGLGAGVGAVPDLLGGLTLSSLDMVLSVQNGARELRFSCGLRLSLGGEDLALSVSVDLKDDSQGRRLELSGVAQFGSEELDLDFTATNSAAGSVHEVVSASFSTTRTLSVGELLGGVPVLSKLLGEASLSLRSANFVLSAVPPSPKRALFGLDLAFSGLDLAQLPVVGAMLPERVAVDDLWLLLASDAFTAADRPDLPATLQELVPDDSPGRVPAVLLTRGVNLRAKLSVGEDSFVFPRPASSPPEASAESAKAADSTTANSPATNAGTSSSAAPDDGAAWLSLDRTLGPLTLSRIGGLYQDEALWFLLDASFQVGVLSMTVDGLGIGTPLPPALPPKLRIRGLSLSFSSGPLELSGGFVADTSMTTFAGEARLKAEVLTLTAFGEYHDGPDGRSCFIFGMLDAPLGGPAAFFVTGLAGGFGYNSMVRLPKADGVKDHTLIRAVIDADTSLNANPGQVLQDLNQRQEVVPTPGESWIAAGVRFTSFELLETFALLIVEFGRTLEIGVLGVTKLSLPPSEEGVEPPKPFAMVEMALSVRVLPDEGELSVTALITPASFVLDPDCKPTGGFAWMVWWGPNPHAGEFVLTVGGYHPRFSVPAYYPSVPRLGFHWPMSDALTIDGAAYFALTHSAVMAGGRLSAIFHLGPIRAWFIAFFDALIEWDPFHFELDIGVSIGVSVRLNLLFVTITITVELSCELELWGPRLGGVAHVSFYIVSFSIPFGADRDERPPRLEWKDFAQRFLPPTDKVLTVALVDGLAPKQAKPPTTLPPAVRGDRVRITLRSAIPPTQIVGSNTLIGAPNRPVRPMADTLADATLTVQIRGVEGGDAVQAAFSLSPLEERVPAAVWGAFEGVVARGLQLADLDEAPELMLTGATLTVKRPKPMTPNAPTLSLELGTALAFDDISAPGSVPATTPPDATTTCAPNADPSWAATTQAAIVGAAATRGAILAALQAARLAPVDQPDEDPYLGRPDLWIRGVPLRAARTA